MSEPKFAPVQLPDRGHRPHGIRFRVPWRIHMLAAKRYNEFGHSQSGGQLAERGGFGIEELIFLLAGENPYATAKEDWPLASDFFNRFPEDEAAHG